MASRFPFLRGWAAPLAVSLAVLGCPSIGLAAPGRDFEQLIVEADEHVSQGRHDQALRAYAESFRAMPPELQPSGVGEFVALAAGKSALDDFAVRGERRSLEQARDILRAFVAAVKRTDPANEPASIEAATQRLSEIGDLLAELDAANQPVNTSSPAPAVEESSAPAEPDAPDSRPDRGRLGLGLVVSGGGVGVAGLGLMIAGARQVPWYEQKLASEGWQTTDEGYDAQTARAERIRNLDYGLGAGALVIGVGLGITGAVLMARSKKGKAGNVALGPMIDRERAGVFALARF